MPTNPVFEEKELKLLLETMIRVRSMLFNCVELRIDQKTAQPKQVTRWVGQRGTFPTLADIEKCLALIRLHVNSEETLSLYDIMGALEDDSKFFK